jgi:ribosomal protein S18 acetylase RimI-like enzyme
VSHFADDLAWVVTGVEDNTYNGVIRCRLSDTSADSVIGDLISRFHAEGLPALWHVEHDSMPADLPRRLLARGCTRLSQGVCMGAYLRDIRQSADEVPDLVIKRITDRAGLAVWMDVWMHFDDGRREPRERLYVSLGVTGNEPLRHYLAWWRGEPVAVSQLFLGHSAAGLYCVATLPEARGRGIGTAITLAPLRDAHASGYDVAVLAPSRESHGMYQRIGFNLFPSTACYFVI